MLFSSGLIAQTGGGESQSTVELYAGTVDACYNASDSYTAKISVKDFIAMKSFWIELKYDATKFAFKSVSILDPSLDPLFDVVNDPVTGEVRIRWSSSTPTTIGDNVKTDILGVNFGVVGFPNNSGTNSFVSSLTWDFVEFYYAPTGGGQDIVRTTQSFPGSMNVAVNYNAITYTVAPASCAGGQANITITSPVGTGLQYYFNGSTTPSTTPTATADAPSTNTVRIKDANGCYSHLFTIPVTAPELLVFNSVSTETPTCYGENGEIQFSISGGTAPYTYWVVPSASYATVQSDLTAQGGNTNAPVFASYKYTNFQVLKPSGSYKVAVTDVNGCTDLRNAANWKDAVIAPSPTQIDFTATPTNILCNGSTNGSIAVSAVSGGTASPTGSYTASINGVNWFAVSTTTPTYTFSNLAAGTYTVTVKDYNGCTTAKAVSVSQPPAITFTLTYQDVACGGTVTPTGSITITGVSGGTATYTFVVATAGSAMPSTGWVDAPGTIGSLAAGYYSIWVKDANGCVKAFANQDLSGNILPIQTPTALAIATSADNAAAVEVSCYGGDYTLTVTASGGTAPYTYSYDGGATTTATTYAMTGLTSDTPVTVVVTDASGCTLTKTVTVDVPTQLVASVGAGSTLSPTCPGGNDGRATVDVVGGTAPYTYSTDNVHWYSNNVLAVPEGLTTIYVKDAKGCMTTTSVTVSALTVTTLVAAPKDEIICHGAKTGTIVVDMRWQAGRTIQYLVSGTQSAVYTTGTVFTPFSIFDGTSTTTTTTPTTFVAGTYYVGARDEMGCTSSVVKVVITEKAALQMTAVVTNATCAGLFDGTLTINTTGGAGQPRYAIVNNSIAIGNLTETNFQLVSTYSSTTTIGKQIVQAQRGTYYVVLRDGCISDNSVFAGPFVVDGYKAITFDGTVAKADITCHDSNNGTITVPLANVKGGKPEFDGAGDYIFTLYKPAGGTVTNTTGAFTGLAGGTYTVTIKDASNCTSVSTISNITIVNPTSVVLTATNVTHFTCKDSRDGQIAVSATGGTPGYWLAVNAVAPGTAITANNPNWIAFGTSTTTTTKTYIATEPGVYYLYVKDANGCIGNTVSVTVLEPTVLAPVAVVTNATCNGANGSVQLSVTGGWGATFSPTNYEFKVGTATNTTGAFSLAAGSYTGSVKVNTGGSMTSGIYTYPQVACSYTVPFTITQPVPYSYKAVTENVKCKGDSNGSLTVTVLGGSAATTTTTGDEYYVQYTTTSNPSLVNDLAHWKLTSGKVYKFTGLPHAIYSVWISNKYDGTGCLIPTGTETPTADGVFTKVASWEVNEPATALTASVTWNKNVTCYAGTDGKFTVTAAGGTAPYKYAAKISQLPAHVLVASELVAGDWKDSNVFDTASAGTWIIWVMDANGCIVGGEGNGTPVDAWRVQVTQPAQVAFSTAKTDAKCFGVANGTITISSITSAGAPFTYTVSGTDYAGNAVSITGSTTATTSFVIGSIPASETQGSTTTKTYTVTLTDKNGCSKTNSLAAPIWQNKVLAVNIVKADGAFLCPGDNNGTIEAVATGGTGTYTYRLWRDGVAYTAWVSIPSFLVQVGHTWAVEVKDANDCIATDEEVINAPVGVTATIKETTCYSDVSASIVIKATGEAGRTFSVRYRLNTASYPTTWTALDANGELAISGLLFSNINVGQNFYFFQIKDDKGCLTELTDKSFVPTQHPLQVTSAVTDLTATMTITGGISPYSYVVGTSTTTVTLPVDNNTFQVVNLAAGQNTITVSDAHGCTYPVTVSVAPLTVTAVPALGTNMKSPFDVMLTFNREVTGVASSTTVTGTGTPTVAISGSGKTYTATITGADMATVTLALSNGIKDLAGNTLSATTFTYTIGDNTAPTATYSPNGVTTEHNYPALVVTFNEDVAVGTAGSVKIVNKATGLASVTIPVSAVTVSGKTATITYAGGLDKNTDYYVTVDAGVVKDLAGNAFAGVTATSTWTFKTGPSFVTGTPDPISSLEFKVYPNPFVDYVTVTNASELSKVVVSNIAGQTVKVVVNPDSTIQLNELRSGVYFISLYQGNTVITTVKIVKR